MAAGAESPLDAEARDASFQPFSPPGDMGGEGQGASFEVYPYNGIGISAPPDRPDTTHLSKPPRQNQPALFILTTWKENLSTPAVIERVS